MSLTLITGVLSGLCFGFIMAIVANVFVLGVKFFSDLRAIELNALLEVETLGISLSAPICLVIAAFLVVIIRKKLNIPRWHGPSDAIFAAHRTDNELDVKSGFGSTLAAFVSASGGASVGQYGPLVHFGATMGSFIRTIAKGSLTTDIYIGCGVAGAISAGFNAPIAGIIFAHEAILRHFSFRAVAPISISSISAAWFSEYIFGSTILFDLSDIPIDLAGVLPSALLAGPVFACVAILFMNSIRHSTRYANSTGWSVMRLAITAAVITGTVGIFIPEILGLGIGALAALLAGHYDLSFLFILFVAKLLLTALCLGWGLFGGVFSPAIFVGASFGAIIGRCIESLGLAGAGVALSICGMAAVSAAVIGAPISAVIIILEMTMNYELALVAMISVMSCVLLTNATFGHSFFDRQLLDRNIDVSMGRGHLELMEKQVIEMTRDSFVQLAPEMVSDHAIEELVLAGSSEAYVVDGSTNKFVGKVSYTDLHGRVGIPVARLLQKNPISIKHDASLQQAMQVASKFVGESIPVLNRKNGILVGVITEADLFRMYLELQEKVVDLERK